MKITPKNNVKAPQKRPFLSGRLFMTLCAALVGAVVPQAWALPNTAPTFVGTVTNLSVSRDASATDIKGLLHVSDIDTRQTLTWTSLVAPAHGMLSISSATASSGSTDITPNGTMTYKPTAGYAGPDSFTIHVSDGVTAASRVISVSVDDGTGVSGASPPSFVNNIQPTAAMTWMIAVRGEFPVSGATTSASPEGYMGEIRFVAWNSGNIDNSSEWVPCEGQLLPINQNFALYSLLSTNFGGDGITTFALPDLRGRVPVGIGQGDGLTPRFLGDKGGQEYFFLTTDTMPAHRHTLSTGNTGVAGSSLPIDNMEPWLALNFSIVENSDSDSVGWIRLFAFSFAPDGFHACDGALLDVSTDAALFAKVGTAFGGDGENTFGLPDLRGRTPMGSGSTHFLGDMAGSEQIVLTADEIPAHTHTYSGGVTGSTGGDQPHDTQQPFLVLNMEISKFGYYAEVGEEQPTVGEVRLFPGSYWLGGGQWVDCDGSLQPIAENEALFQLIGTTYGGDGEESFALPNDGDRVLAGVGQGVGTDLTPRSLGNIWGYESETLSLEQLPAHTHLFNFNPVDISLGNSSVNQSAGVNASVGSFSTTDPDVVDSHTYSLVGGSGAIDNASFTISGATLYATNAGAMAPGYYDVRVLTDDGNGGTFQKQFIITVTDDVSPGLPTSFSGVATSSNVGLSWINPTNADFGGVTIQRSGTGFPSSVTDGTLVGQGLNGTSYADNGLTDGTYYYSIFARDTSGNYSAGAQATVVVDATGPTITSALTANGSYGSGFTYTITADDSLVTFGASGLPDGLDVNTNTGAISGTPTLAGLYNVVLSATDSHMNVGTVTLSLNIAKANASINLGNLSQVYNGAGRAVSVGTTPDGLAFHITYDGLSDAPTNAGSYTVFGAVTDGNYTGSVTNTLVIAPLGATVVLSGLSQTYDGTGRSVSASTTPSDLTVNLNYAGLTDAPTNSGSYVVVGRISDGNYQGSVTDMLVIATSSLTVTADNMTRAYGETNPVFTGTITGAAIGDDFTANYTTTATTTSLSGGSYAIVPSLIDAAGKAGNYMVTTNNGTLTITALPFVLHLEAYSTNQGPIDVDNPFPMDESRISANGEMGRVYSILVSTNMTDWSVLTNITADTNGMVEFTEELPTHTMRFFRGLMP